MPQAFRISILLIFLLLYFLWGSTFLAIRLSVETIPPLLVGCFRHLGAGVLLLVIRLCFSKVTWKMRPTLNALWVGSITLGLSNGSLILVEKTVPSSLPALAFTSMPLVMLLLNWVSFEKVKPALLDWVVIALGMFGTILVIGGGQSDAGRPLSSWEVSLLLANSLFWAFGSLLGRRLTLPSSMVVSSSLQMVGGGLLFLGLATINQDWRALQISPPSTESLWAVAYLGLFGSLLGYSCFAYLIKNVDSRLVATFAFVSPIVGWGIGLWWGEKTLSPELVLGAVLSIFSVATLVLTRICGFRKKSV
jgi:drug/metabolite transporter (DMT)-like permease